MLGDVLPLATHAYWLVRKEIVAAWQDAMAKTYEDPEMKRRAIAAGTSVAWVPDESIRSVMERGRKVAQNPKHLKMLKSLLGQ